MSDWATPYARGVEQDGRDSAVMMTMDKVAKHTIQAKKVLEER